MTHIVLKLVSRRSWLTLLALAVCLVKSGSAKEVWTGVERIVAIGDVHGDYQQFVTLLRQTDLTDQQENWIGGRAHLVQTGDVPDRGPDSRQVMDLLMKLEKQARKAKGQVHALIGNHEAMNIYGDLRYVHPAEFEAFKTAASIARRGNLYEQHIEQLRRSPPPSGLPKLDDAYREKWEVKHPPGYFSHREAFQQNGKYNRWIRRHNTVVKINGILFLHGGIGPKFVDLSLAEINRQVRDELADLEKLETGIVVDEEGPLWYRGLALHPEAQERSHLETLLARHRAQRIVMGHTVTVGTVWPRFEDRAILIDVGLSESYGRRLACLVVEGDQAFAIHRGKRLKLPDDSGQGLLRYLGEAAALDPVPSPLATTIEELKTRLASDRSAARKTQ